MKARWLLLATFAALVVGMLALAGAAWAGGDGCTMGCEPPPCPIGENCNPDEEPPPPPPGTPTVVRTVPADEATGVDPNANIKVKFSEAMRARTINERNFTLLQDDVPCPPETPNCAPVPPTVPLSVRYNATTKTAILNPVVPLYPNNGYRVVVEGAGDGDGRAVKDRDGNPMASDYVFDFTTGSGG